MAKFFFAVIALFMGISCSVNSEELPDGFFLLKPIDLPIDRKSSFPSRRFSFEQDALKENQGSRQPIYNLYKSLMAKKSTDIFSIYNERWSGYRDANEKKTKGLRVAKIPCVKPFDCFLVNPDSGTWIVVSRNKEVIDFQLSHALQYFHDDKNHANELVGELDSIFGEAGLFPYPDTDYGKTGVFCSILTTTSPDGGEHIQIFKRRITPEGKIENKVLPEGEHECKLPW